MKLLLADDHTLFRDALLQYIERAEPSSCVLLAKDLSEALEVLKESPDQDLVLLDLRMPGMHGLDGFKLIRESYPSIPVALMSGVAEPKDVEAAMALGAVGYFPKTLSGKALLKAIQLVMTGERFIPVDHDTNKVMLSYFDDSSEQHSAGEQGTPFFEREDIKLTPREREVLSYLQEGGSNKEIANALGVQVVTVKLHVRGICRKLGAKNRTQAALKAQDLGLSRRSV